MRAKRFVFNANLSCGFIPFCSPLIHSRDYNLSTTLADDPACNGTAAVTAVVLELLLSVCIVIGNTLILYVMNTSSCFRNPQGVFKTSLATSDFLVGAIILPSTACNKIHVMFQPLGQNHLDYFNSTKNTPLSIFLGMLFSICISASLFSLMLLAVDRMLAIVWPFKYSQGHLMTRRRAKALVIATWCLSVLLGILPLGDTTRFSYQLDYMTLSRILAINASYNHQPTQTAAHGIFFLVLVFIFPYVCVVVITTVTWLKFVSSRTTSCGFASRSREASNTSSPAGQPLNKELERVTLTIFIMVAVFSVCVLPFLAVQVENLLMAQRSIAGVTEWSRGCDPVLYLVSVELLYMNSLTNFVIYNLRNKFFRSELRGMVRPRRCQATSISCC